MKKNDNLVLNQHTIPYIHVARTVPIFIIVLHGILPRNGAFYTYKTYVITAKA